MSVEKQLSERCMHSCVTYGDSLYFFGGENSESLWTNDFYSLTLTQGQPVWKQENENTLKRDGHSATVVENEMYVLGGSTNAKSDKIQLSCYNFETKEWSNVDFSGDSPSPRKLHSVSYSAKLGELVIFGGQTLEKKPKYLDDLYTFNIKEKTFKKVEVENSNPKPRSGHSSVIKDDKMYVFGGSNVSDDTVRYFNDLNVFDVETMSWSKLSTKGDVPAARDNHKCICVSDKLYIYGGWCPKTTNDNSVYELDLNSSTWSKVKNSDSSIRYSHAFAYLDSTFIIFGGRNSEMKLLKDVSVFKLQDEKDIENLTTQDDVPEQGWIVVVQKKQVQKPINVFENKEKKQTLDDVVIKKVGKKKKRAPTKKVNIASTLETMDKSDIALPSDDKLESLEKEAIKEDEVKKPKGVPMGGVGMFGGFNPGQVQLKKSGTGNTPTSAGTNPFGGFNPGQVQLKKTPTSSPSQTPLKKGGAPNAGMNPFGGFKPKPKNEEK
eukprot:gene11723-5062_t